MKIANIPPPNYKEIQKHFPKARFEDGVLFTYGDTCYCKKITPDLIVHEETHAKQQIDPEKWWSRYFVDKEFRLEQELEAYKNQLNYLKKQTKDRNVITRITYSIAKDLTSEVYGGMITHSEALKKLK